MKRTQRVEYKRTKSAILELLLRDFDFEAQYFLAQNRPFSRERSLKSSNEITVSVMSFEGPNLSNLTTNSVCC